MFFEEAFGFIIWFIGTVIRGLLAICNIFLGGLIISISILLPFENMLDYYGEEVFHAYYWLLNPTNRIGIGKKQNYTFEKVDAQGKRYEVKGVWYKWYF